MTSERYEQIGCLFDAALEREPAERAAFLAEACGADELLHAEVASLLASHEQAADFIETPPNDLAAAWQAASVSLPVERCFAHYDLISLLGRGGMGEVWLAEDHKLGRKVAVKLLPAEFTTDSGRVHRFEQEARSASALNHPNIITIHEIGEVGISRYIVTEYVDGETLRQRMKNASEQRLPVNETLDLAVQIAEALSAAHEAGIVHRDIKPENVMVRRDGYVKVLDFGLAKLTEPAIGDEPATTAGNGTTSGMVMGTPRYMSPEQARGEKMDARTDIFSLGVLIYEMLAGRPPFAGSTAGELIAAILRDEPPPLADDLPGTSLELVQIIDKALSKERAERYQTAADLLADLNRLKRRIESGVKPDKPVNTARRRVALSALIVFVVLVIVAFAGWFYSKREPVLTAKDTIVLADFDNRTGDDIFDGTLKQGLAIQLQQSPFLNLFPEVRTREMLALMGRSPTERVTAGIAREICERLNLKALIAGSIAPLGSHYVITLETINARSGEVLAREQAEAESREQVLRSLSQAAAKLREKLGESLASIQRFDKPLEQVRTSKLEAFKAWSIGIEYSYSGRPMEAIPFYKRAVEIDPDFAHAYSVLSVVHWSIGLPELASGYAEKGYALRDRVNEYEQLRIVNFYHGFTTGDLNKRMEVLTLLKRGYPHESTGPNDLALTCIQIGRFEDAVAEAREAMRLNPHFGPSHWALGSALLRLNRFGEAKDAYARAVQLNLDIAPFKFILYQIAFIESAGGETAEMRQQIDWMRGRPDEYAAFDWQTGAAAFGGQWRKAQKLGQQSIDLAARGETREIAARYATEQALRGAVFGDCRQAGADAAQGLQFARGRASLPRAALAFALCGEAKQALPLIDEMTRRFPQDTIINSIWLPEIRAAIELQRGNAAQAIERLQPTASYEPAAEFWPQYLRGQAYLKLGRGVEAAAEFQKILDHRGQAPLSALYPLASAGLARAAGGRGGDPATSRKACEDFLTLWKDADPGLPALIGMKQECQRLR